MERVRGDARGQSGIQGQMARWPSTLLIAPCPPTTPLCLLVAKAHRPASIAAPPDAPAEQLPKRPPQRTSRPPGGAPAAPAARHG